MELLLLLLLLLSQSSSTSSSGFEGLSEEGMQSLMCRWYGNKSLKAGVLSDKFYVLISSILAYPLILLKGAQC
jgi:hypothetical protein